MGKISEKLGKLLISFRKRSYNSFSALKNIDISRLLTENRKDIDIRIDFLTEVLDGGKDPKDTFYYRFISDKRRLKNPGAIDLNGDYMVNKFLELYRDICRDGFNGHVFADKVFFDEIKTHYLVGGQKKYVKIPNTSGYQLLQGAHRIAIQKYLGETEIPCMVTHGSKASYPNYKIFIDEIMKPSFCGNRVQNH